MNCPRLTSKPASYEALIDGRLGNTLRTWAKLKTLRPVLTSGVPRVSIRYLDWGSKFKAHNVALGELEQTCARLRTQGAEFSKMVFNETPPDTRVRLQTDVMLTTEGWTLFYSRQKNMRHREALALDGQQVSSLRALEILQSALWPSDMEDLRVLMEQYPDHVVELTSFDVAVGKIPHRNTIIWEVRADY